MDVSYLSREIGRLTNGKLIAYRNIDLMREKDQNQNKTKTGVHSYTCLLDYHVRTQILNNKLRKTNRLINYVPYN